MRYFEYNPYYCYQLLKIIKHLKSGGRIPKGLNSWVATVPAYERPSFGAGLLLGLGDFAEGVAEGASKFAKDALKFGKTSVKTLGKAIPFLASRTGGALLMALTPMETSRNDVIFGRNYPVMSFPDNTTFNGYPYDYATDSYGTVPLDEVVVIDKKPRKKDIRMMDAASDTGDNSSDDNTVSTTGVGKGSEDENGENENKGNESPEEKGRKVVDTAVGWAKGLGKGVLNKGFDLGKFYFKHWKLFNLLPVGIGAGSDIIYNAPDIYHSLTDPDKGSYDFKDFSTDGTKTGFKWTLPGLIVGGVSHFQGNRRKKDKEKKEQEKKEEEEKIRNNDIFYLY